jgi:hypothetical protein
MSVCKDFSHIAFTLTHIHIEQFGTLETVGPGMGGSVGKRDTVGSENVSNKREGEMGTLVLRIE